MASMDPYGDRKMALLEQQYQESVREFDQHQQLLREQLAQQLAQDKGLKEQELANALKIAGQGNITDFNKMLAGLKGPADPYAYLFMSHGMATPRGYASAPMALPESVRQALGGPEAVAKMQQSLTGANSGSMFAYGQSHEYTVDDHGNLIHTWTDPNTNQQNVEKLASGLTPGQDVQSYLDPGTNQTQLSVQTASGEQQNLRYNPQQGWNSQIIPKAEMAAAGQPGAVAHMDAYGQQHNYWVGPQGGLQHTWQDMNTGAQHQEQLLGGRKLMPGQNIGLTYNQQTGQTSLQFQGPLGKWGTINYVPGRGWGGEAWGTVGPTGALTNTPSPYQQNLPDPTWGGNGGAATQPSASTGVIPPPGSPTGPQTGATTNPNATPKPPSPGTKTDTGGVTMGGVNGAPAYAGMLGGMPTSLTGNTQVQSPLIGSAAPPPPSNPIGTGAGAPLGGDATTPSTTPSVPTPGASTQPQAQPASGPNANAASPLLAQAPQGGIGSGIPNPNDPNAPKKPPVFDSGGVLAPGINVVNNATGAPEPLVNPNNTGGNIHDWMSQLHTLLGQHPGMQNPQAYPHSMSNAPQPMGMGASSQVPGANASWNFKNGAQVRPPAGQPVGPDRDPWRNPQGPIRTPIRQPVGQGAADQLGRHIPQGVAGGPIRSPGVFPMATSPVDTRPISSSPLHNVNFNQSTSLTGGHLGSSTGSLMGGAAGSTYAPVRMPSGGPALNASPGINNPAVSPPLGAAATPSTTVGTGAGAPLGTDSTPQPSATAAAGASSPLGGMSTTQSPLLTGGNADQTKYGKPPLGLDKISPAVRGLVNKGGTPIIPSMQAIKDMPQSDYDSYKNYIDQVAGGNSQDMEDMAKQLAPKGAPIGKFGGAGGSGV